MKDNIDKSAADSDLQLVRRLCRCCKTTLYLEEKKLYVFDPSSSSNSAKSEVCLWMQSQGRICTLHYKNNVDDRYYDVDTYGSSLEDACKNFLDTALDPRYSLKTDSSISSSKKSSYADFPDESVDTREKLSIWLALRGF